MSKKTKSALIQEMPNQNEGAFLQAIANRLGWPFHSGRVANSRLRKQGTTVERSGKGADAIYRISDAPGKSE